MTKKDLQKEVLEWSQLQTEISQSAVVLKANANTKNLAQESRTKWIQPNVQLHFAALIKVNEMRAQKEKSVCRWMPGRIHFHLA